MSINTNLPFNIIKTGAVSSIDHVSEPIYRTPQANQCIEAPKLKPALNKDVFKVNKKGELKVNVFRIWFDRLKKEQIATINETRELPKNIKIRPKKTQTGYYMYHNIFGLRNGSNKLPEDYELRQNILGFTRLVPKNTEGFWLRKKEKNNKRQ